MILALLVTALAGDWSVGAGAGLDDTTADFWVGAEAQLHARPGRLVNPVLRAAPGVGLIERVPLMLLDGGVLIEVPEDEATVRVGLLAVANLTIDRGYLPVALGDPTTTRPGLLPGVLAVVEFEWKPEAPLVVGLRLGAASRPISACEEGDDPDFCRFYSPGLSGGFYAKKAFRNGLNAEIQVGTSMRAILGYRF